MTCDICAQEADLFIGIAVGAPGHERIFNGCGRCGVVMDYLKRYCESAALTPHLDCDLRRYVETITVDLASFENLRRMTRQEFRALLRARLQEFGDKCLAVWDEKCGGRDETQ
jgi:hypothetical protein